MPDELNIKLLTIAGLAHRCTQETELFFQRQSNDPRYCFELFRRAIHDHNEQAWEIIYVQYQTLVVGWVQRHPMFESAGEGVDYFANRAFEKMWASLTAERFEHFPDLKSVLRYLQMCVHSVVIDHVRMAEAAAEEASTEAAEAESSMQDTALDQVYQREFWRWLNAHLHDEKERIVVHGSFVLNLKPRELYDQYPQLFSDVAEIYRVKQNVLVRLRRDPEFEQYLR